MGKRKIIHLKIYGHANKPSISKYSGNEIGLKNHLKILGKKYNAKPSEFTGIPYKPRKKKNKRVNENMNTVLGEIVETMIDENPIETKEHMFQEMSRKAMDAIEQKKVEIARNYFGQNNVVSEEQETIDETMTRKHFQMVADVIKAHPDENKRNELAKHHAEIFKKSNPRFDHSRFYKAAGSTLKEEEEVVSEEKGFSAAYKTEVGFRGLRRKARDHLKKSTEYAKGSADHDYHLKQHKMISDLERIWKKKAKRAGTYRKTFISKK